CGRVPRGTFPRAPRSAPKQPQGAHMVDKSEKFSWLVRLGYAARGLTYFLLGYMALGTRIGEGDSNTAVLDMLQDVPLGVPLLYLMAIGLAAYVVFKLASAIGDVQNRGTDTKGIA